MRGGWGVAAPLDVEGGARGTREGGRERGGHREEAVAKFLLPHLSLRARFFIMERGEGGRGWGWREIGSFLPVLRRC